MARIKKYQDGGTTDKRFGNRTKDYLDKTKTRESFKVSGGDYKVVTKSKSTPSGVERETKLKRTLKGALKGGPKGSTLSKPLKTKTSPVKFNTPPVMKKGGGVKAKGGKQMIKRADGSYSQRGLWDNIRANRGSGKKPTAAMLKQERKIKAKSKK